MGGHLPAGSGTPGHPGSSLGVAGGNRLQKQRGLRPPPWLDAGARGLCQPWGPLRDGGTPHSQGPAPWPRGTDFSPEVLGVLAVTSPAQGVGQGPAVPHQELLVSALGFPAACPVPQGQPGLGGCGAAEEGMRQPPGPGALLGEVRGSACCRPLEPGRSGVTTGGCTCPVPRHQQLPGGLAPIRAVGTPAVPRGNPRHAVLGVAAGRQAPAVPSAGTHHPPAAAGPPWVIRGHPARGGTRGDKCHPLP